MANPLKGVFVLAAGGTGGHMFPALAMARTLIGQGASVHLVTDMRGVEYLPPVRDFAVHVLPVTGLGQAGQLARLRGACTLVPAFLTCLYSLLHLKPSGVIGFGGYPSAPCLAASRLLRIPFWLQEQNAHMGRVNRFFAKSAQGIGLGFSHTQGLRKGLKHLQVIGVPVRAEIQEVRAHPYGLKEDGAIALRILVLGGSQGARVFSRILPAALAQMTPAQRAQISMVQQCRVEDQEALGTAYRALGVNHTLAAFIPHVAAALETTDLVIARAGASTVGEVIAAARPALFVPLPSAMDDHQYANAQALSHVGAAWSIREEKLTPRGLEAFLQKCLEQPAMLQHAQAALWPLLRTQSTQAFSTFIADQMRMRMRA